MGQLQSFSPRSCDPKNPNLFRCNNSYFLVSAFSAAVFSYNAEALSTRGDGDGEESLRRLAAWLNGSAKPAAIPFSGSGDDGHNSSAPLDGIVTKPSSISDRFENTRSIPSSGCLFLLQKPETKRKKRSGCQARPGSGSGQFSLTREAESQASNTLMF
ncbi:hypothetical protein MRB53_005215 [Persea americana]|uniref:Uncharacterized protein n=1 Tax=Persea americana TaxID=3435 RepID=A0ACC2MCF7_PERAE|nr:hypothetical protein MRB53_005215 [Persea americana]